jgi:diacylglycerol kinase family enzyme
MMNESKQRIHVVINPAAGKDEPILNTINDVFNQRDIDWSISVTRKFGDATEFARQAVEDGYDIVAGYGGDGTQHEIANGILGTKALMGVLPGGTGNGFANEMGTPSKLRPALELLCGDHKIRHVDVVQVNDDLTKISTAPSPMPSRLFNERGKYQKSTTESSSMETPTTSWP